MPDGSKITVGDLRDAKRTDVLVTVVSASEG